LGAKCCTAGKADRNFLIASENEFHPADVPESLAGTTLESAFTKINDGGGEINSMRKKADLYGNKLKWHGREGFVLGNHLIRLVTLTGGGHVAEFKFEESSGNSTLNPLWVPPWKTIDPNKYDPGRHKNVYGSPIEGKLLAGITGHNICLDYFGAPSPEEVQHGLAMHGEAPNCKWKIVAQRTGVTAASVKLAVPLPAAGLRFSREISLRPGESVAYFQETIVNERKADHFFHWVQHVTLGPPFLTAESSRVAVPGTRGMTSPSGYDEGKALLASKRAFRWPMAPKVTGGTRDLTRPFSHPGLGFVVGVLVDPRTDVGFIAAFNPAERLLIGYCFSRQDCPWVTLWEENLGIEAAPWSRRTQAHGLEFGSTPLALPRRESFLAGGPLFGTPTITFVPALGKKQIRYLSFLASAPPEFEGLRDIRIEENNLLLFGAKKSDPLPLAASGIREIFPG
jgi:hypothetical protein